MESRKNPFPGMNPFLEVNWGPVHTALVSFIWEQIGPLLPDDLVARPEERITIGEPEIPSKDYRGDVAVSESWKQGVSPSWTPVLDSDLGPVGVAVPQILHMEEEVERWIEIRTHDGTVVTVIELLSPANKGVDALRYRFKQRDYLRTSASLVEIDLLRGGQHVLAAPKERIREKSPGTCYHVCVCRSWRPDTREVYSCPLRERLPAFAIPLRDTDRDIVLDLQPLIDRCYEVGRYYAGDFSHEPPPPFPADEAAWVDECLRAAGLRF